MSRKEAIEALENPRLSESAQNVVENLAKALDCAQESSEISKSNFKTGLTAVFAAKTLAITQALSGRPEVALGAEAVSWAITGKVAYDGARQIIPNTRRLIRSASDAINNPELRQTIEEETGTKLKRKGTRAIIEFAKKARKKGLPIRQRLE